LRVLPDLGFWRWLPGCWAWIGLKDYLSCRGRWDNQSWIGKEGDTMAVETARILREASAGLPIKGDVLVRLSPAPAESGIQLDIESKVMSMFGDQIRASVLEIIESYGLTDLIVAVQDQGALDYVIRARVQAAIERAIREDK
jgi:citrate lyase subunit gamma (acyl carrier protein)